MFVVAHNFLELRSRKTVRFLEQIMSADMILAYFRAKWRLLIMNCDLSVSCKSVICRYELLTTDKSRYFAQPCPIINNYKDLDRNTSVNMKT